MAAQKGDNHEFNQSTTQERDSEIISSMGSASAFNNSSLHLIVEKLNSNNYREWTHAIKLVIDINGKLEFLTGETQRPPLTDAAASWKWRSKNSFITSCIINSMKPTIDKIKDIGKSWNTIQRCWVCGKNLVLAANRNGSECTGDNVRFKKKMENEKVFEFLAGLNRDLDDVRNKVLSRRPLPSI
ncbi:hypothetical protein CK203_016087 [Vitis vinifera]|uniref:Retrotransposon Copia-like N-terminal domain-containing protein n=1 Tax=Vitis vinifera TaxID=29760 RepID=A0A438JMU9_VITVI|nr:hypothetical protein CK203_016087 [Vitis vinifera]